MVQFTEHAHLNVTDLTAATNFYTDVLGMVVLEDRGGTVYLGCGLDEHYDLALTDGDTGVEHFAIRTTPTELADLRTRLDQRGVPYQPVDTDAPDHDQALRTTMPTGVTIEFLVTDRDRYNHISDTAHPDRGELAPLDFDHINLASNQVQADAEFLRDVLGASVTEVQRDPDTDTWELVFTRFGDYHHDTAISIVDDATATLHHIAFTMESADHLKSCIDNLVRHGHELEVGVSRHRAGNNLFAYLWSPGGNRIELSTEMATLAPNTDTLYRDETFTFTSWGGIEIPDSFSNGS